jgi:hypothetical protein
MHPKVIVIHYSDDYSFWLSQFEEDDESVSSLGMASC